VEHQVIHLHSDAKKKEEKKEKRQIYEKLVAN
jgi:hypothetical protein